MKTGPGLVVIVCGGRSYSDRDFLFARLDELAAAHSGVVVFEGGAAGADSLAKEWAGARRQRCQTFSADWKKHGKGAGPVRNSEMLAELLVCSHGTDGREARQMVVAFPGGRGTGDMVGKAKKADVDVWDLRGSDPCGPVPPFPVPAAALDATTATRIVAFIRDKAEALEVIAAVDAVNRRAHCAWAKARTLRITAFEIEDMCRKDGQ